LPRTEERTGHADVAPASPIRQGLFERHTASALDAIEHLVGPKPPGAVRIGLWTRLTDFTPADLSDLLKSRQAVRNSMMRATIHLASATTSSPSDLWSSPAWIARSTRTRPTAGTA
jgi:hypothetical protein